MDRVDRGLQWRRENRSGSGAEKREAAVPQLCSRRGYGGDGDGKEATVATATARRLRWRRRRQGRHGTSGGG
ncbi:hypothetical protein L3X38_042016 [Prunus dulcis]|uniref:Uncharacterized protein n=1 Tax=Prunus dulcis TaxID=3755 RepID=A0AAD4UW12_PRUDU|nr:hypothetical protein L3X38_042016 [Prunus dulcis]